MLTLFAHGSKHILDILEGNVSLEHLAECLQALHLAIVADVVVSQTEDMGAKTLVGADGLRTRAGPGRDGLAKIPLST